MPRRSRNYIKSSFFHIMVQGINRENIFKDNVDKKEYLKIIERNKEKVNISIISYCIMDNHSHFLIKTDSVQSLSCFMHKINSFYAMYYNTKYNRVGYVFRGRYKSQIIYSEKQLYTCINYIHNNPVKAKIVTRPDEYKYSSYIKYNNKVIQNIINNEYLEHEGKDIEFLEDEDEKETEIQDVIKEYLLSNNLKYEELNKKRTNLEEIIYTLKNEYKISSRKIAQYLNIGRETIRKIVNELSKRYVPIDKLKGE